MAFAEAARSLAARGFRVHPLRTGSKVALVEGWPEKATTDRAQIDAWWSKWPDANIGIAAGQGLTVIDLDGDEGVSSWTELTKANDIPPTLAVRTPRGWHLYFAADGIANSANRLGQHVDVRGDGGYVVGPGSVVDGKEYVEHEAPIAAAPAWLVSMARGESVSPSSEKLPRPNYEPAGTYGEGERNDGLFRLASSYRARGMSESELLAALLVANQERCIPPLDGAEVRLIASSASRFERGETPAKIIHRGSSSSGGEMIASDEGIDLADLAELPVEPLPASLPFLGRDHVLYAEVANLLFAFGKVGKTTAIAHSLADWIAAGHSVLYISEENRRNWQQRMSREKLSIPKGVRLIEGRQRTVPQLLALALSADEDVIVLDTARHLLNIEDESDNSMVARGLKPWVDLAVDGRTVVIVHHENKAGGDKSASGAGAWISEPDWIVKITKDGGEDSPRRKIVCFGRPNEEQHHSYERLPDGRMTAEGRVHQNRKGAATERRARVLSVLSAEPLTTSEICGLIPGFTDDTIRADLESLESTGMVCRHVSDRGSYSWNRPPTNGSIALTSSSVIHSSSTDEQPRVKDSVVGGAVEAPF